MPDNVVPDVEPDEDFEDDGNNCDTDIDDDDCLFDDTWIINFEPIPKLFLKSCTVYAKI